VEIVGIEEGGRGRYILSVEKHLQLTALFVSAAFKSSTVSKLLLHLFGIDRCLVGFLPRYYIPHKDRYEGRVACQALFG
jgi:hypothetical protein